MPCDSITTQSINLANADRMLLTEALIDMGCTILDSNTTCIYATNNRGGRITWTNGEGLAVSAGSSIRSSEIIQTVTQAYSKTAISWAAQRAGWTMKSTGPNTLTLQRR
jgi:hypothetical protein